MDALLRDPSGSAPKASRQRVAITQMNLALDPELARKEEWRKLGMCSPVANACVCVCVCVLCVYVCV